MDIKSAKILQPLPPYKKSLYGFLRISRAKNRLSIAKQFEILIFQNFKFSGKISKKIIGYKISKNSPASATLQNESLWTLEGIQSKKLHASSNNIRFIQNSKIQIFWFSTHVEVLEKFRKK
jgi:hypothetical protein